MSKTKTPAPEAAEVRIDPAAVAAVLLPGIQSMVAPEEPDPVAVEPASAGEEPDPVVVEPAPAGEDPDPATVDPDPAGEDPQDPVPPEEGKGGNKLPEHRLYVVDTASGLNLRAGPGMEFEILAVLPNGSCVEEMTLLADPWDAAAFEVSVPGWVMVRYVADGAERAGWVDRRYLVPLFAEEEPG